MSVEYPYKITLHRDVVMTLRRDEVTIVNGKHKIEAADAFERLFWELSNSHLNKIKGNLAKGKIFDDKDSVLTHKFVQMINKILTQRKFMQDNQSFRDALIPE